MLKKPTPMQYELEMVTFEELVPTDHVLRKVGIAVTVLLLSAARTCPSTTNRPLP